MGYIRLYRGYTPGFIVHTNIDNLIGGVYPSCRKIWHSLMGQLVKCFIQNKSLSMIAGKGLSLFVTAATYWCTSAGTLTPSFKFHHHKS